MLRWITSRFEAEQRQNGNGMLRLIVSDYLACYRQRGEAPGRLALLFIPRTVANSQLHATALLRVALRGPRPFLPLWRTVLLAKHSIDLMPDVEIGPGLRLPHPHTITFGPAARIGSDVTIFHNVTIGGTARPAELRVDRLPQYSRATHPRSSPLIEDDVIIYTGSLVFGPITVGRGSVVGAQSWLDHDLAPGVMHQGRGQ
jgi:serine acetyltransferase